MSCAADGGLVGTGQSVAVSSDQRAIIVKTGNEISLTLSTAYSGNGADFCWIVPTPVPPAAEDVNESGVFADIAFRKLADQTSPVIVHRGGFLGVDSETPIANVEVHGTAILEHFEVAVLSSDSALSLLDWLQENGYHVGANAERVLDAYVRDGWAFTAIKLNPWGSRQYDNEYLPAITLKYHDERLVFPLRISSISTSESVRITLYVLAGSTVSPSNLPSEPLVYKDSLSEWITPEEYVERCIRETADSGGTSLVALWKGGIQAQGLAAAMRRLIGSSYDDGLVKYISRYEALLSPDEMTSDIYFEPDRQPETVKVGFGHPLFFLEPTHAPGLEDVDAISTSQTHSVALKRDGTIWFWGNTYHDPS